MSESEFDGVVRALSDGSRRRMLIALRDQERIHPFSDNGDERDRALQPHHVHLPFLEDNDLVAWNRDAGAVRRGNGVEAVERVLAALEARRDALPDGYLPEEGQTC